MAGRRQELEARRVMVGRGHRAAQFVILNVDEIHVHTLSVAEP